MRRVKVSVRGELDYRIGRYLWCRSVQIVITKTGRPWAPGFFLAGLLLFANGSHYRNQDTGADERNNEAVQVESIYIALS